MRKLYYKTPNNKREALKFVYFLDIEWGRCLDVKNKRKRCKAIMKIHKAALECRDDMKNEPDSPNLKMAISVIEKWLNVHRLSGV